MFISSLDNCHKKKIYIDSEIINVIEKKFHSYEYSVKVLAGLCCVSQCSVCRLHFNKPLMFVVLVTAFGVLRCCKKVRGLNKRKVSAHKTTTG